MIESQTQGSSATPSVSDVVVTPVTTAAEKKEFILCQYELSKNDPNFVPPLLMERNDFLNPKKNPWF